MVVKENERQPMQRKLSLAHFSNKVGSGKGGSFFSNLTLRDKDKKKEKEKEKEKEKDARSIFSRGREKEVLPKERHRSSSVDDVLIKRIAEMSLERGMGTLISGNMPPLPKH